MRDKNVDPVRITDLESKAPGSLSHFSFRIHVGTVLIAHRAAEAGDPESLVIVYHIFNANAPSRRVFVISGVVVPAHIQERNVAQRDQKFEEARAQVAAGNDKVDAFQLVRGIIIPKRAGFLVGDCKDLHYTTPSQHITP